MNKKKVKKQVEIVAEKMATLDTAGYAIIVLRSNSEADNRRVVDLYEHKDISSRITRYTPKNAVSQYPHNIYEVNNYGMLQEFGKPFEYIMHAGNDSDNENYTNENSLMAKLSSCLSSNEQRHTLIYFPDNSVILNDDKKEDQNKSTYIHLLKNIARLKRQGRREDNQQKYNEYNHTEKGRINTLIVISCTNGILCQELRNYAYILDVPCPDTAEIMEIIEDAEKSCSTGSVLSPANKKSLAETMRGLREDDIRIIFNLAYAEHENPSTENLRTTSENAKKQLIEGVPGLFWKEVDNPKLGGLQNLISWLNMKVSVFTYPRAAREKEAKPPKGILLCGLPGTGKTTLARYLAKLLGIPLVILKISDLKDKWVGNTEANCRIALQTIDSVSPCVVLIDEIEKVLSGVGSGGAHETTNSMFSEILDWLQSEKEKPTFVIATANKTHELPGELRRKGRFDETFFVGVFTKEDCENVFRIHLDKKKNVFEWSEEGCNKIISEVLKEAASIPRFLNGADIECIVKDAFCDLFTASIMNMDSKKTAEIDENSSVIPKYKIEDVKNALIYELKRTRSYFDSNMETTALYWVDMYTQQFLDANAKPEEPFILTGSNQAKTKSNENDEKPAVQILPIEPGSFDKNTFMFDEKSLFGKKVTDKTKSESISKQYSDALDKHIEQAKTQDKDYNRILRFQLAKCIFELENTPERND